MRSIALFVLSAVLSLPLIAHGQTHVEGRIETDTTWNIAGSPYVLTGDVEVVGGATLTIEDGARVQGMAGARLIIGEESVDDTGTLHVLGGTRVARFSEHVDGQPWGGLVLRSGAVDARYGPDGSFQGGSIIRGAVFQEAVQPILMTDTQAFLDSVTVLGSASPDTPAVYINIRSSELRAVRARGLEVRYSPGYGLRLEGGAAHVLQDCTFSENGGGVYLLSLTGTADAEPIRFERCTFSQNGVGGPMRDGGGLLLGTFGGLELTDCTFRSNVVLRNGGGIWGSSSGSVAFKACDFIENHAGQSGGGADFWGGTITIEDSVFMENTAERSAAGYLGNGNDSSTLFMRRCEFRDNRAWRGGAASLFFGPTNIEDCEFVGNVSTADGGAIRFFGVRGTIGLTGNRFVDNTTAGEGGAVGFIDSDLHESVTFTGNTFEGNIARLGGAVYTTNIDDDISTFSFADRDGAPNTFRNNIAQLGDNIYHAGPVDIDATGVCWGVALPAAIANRIHDGRDEPGLGIVSFDPVASTCDTCRTDLDGDGALTLFDYLAFTGLFGLGDPQADFDGDGALTIFDFLVYQTEFEAGCG